jgi:hypothetical protein
MQWTDGEQSEDGGFMCGLSWTRAHDASTPMDHQFLRSVVHSCGGAVRVTEGSRETVRLGAATRKSGTVTV